MQKRALKHIRAPGETGGYSSTVDASVQQGRDKEKAGGPVNIETNPEKIKLLEDEGWSVSKCLWPEVREALNKANNMMKRFLIDNFDVVEFHPMIKDFGSKAPSELSARLKDSLSKKDNNLFKKEEQQAIISTEEHQND